MFRTTLALLVLTGMALAVPSISSADENFYDTVDAHLARGYTYQCTRSGTVAVVIIGDGDTDLDLFVRDQRGNLIVGDEGYTDRAIVRFHARAGQVYTIEVHNLGSVWNEYEFALAD